MNPANRAPVGARIALALYGLFLSAPAPGCGGECGGVTGPIVARAGTGDPSNPTQYRALSDGETVQLTTGNQGGQHVWVQLRATGMCPEAASARVRAVRAADGERVGQAISTPQRWNAVPGAPGTFASETLAVQVDDRYFCALLQGGALRLEYTVDDGRGSPVSGSVGVVVRGWSDDSLAEQRDGRDQCCRDFTNTACWPGGVPRDAGADSTSDAGADAANPG